MIVFVTQGHENGIGIEIFLKSFSLLSKDKKSRVHFIGYQNSVLKTIRDCNLPESLLCDLNIIQPKDFIFSESLSSLIHGMSLCQSNDILITQPTTKDQLIYDEIKHLGHTEFFRYFYKNSGIPMSFIGPKANVLLLSDHLPLKDVSSLDDDIIFKRVINGLNGFSKANILINNVYLSGINPHAGENGLLGTDDIIIEKLQQRLTEKFNGIKFWGPISGDALHYKASSNSLLVYSFHDQGLSYFKSHNGLLGINTTFGLPFLRLSVDHGTAFDLYGKNKADFSSMIYLFDFVFRI